MTSSGKNPSTSRKRAWVCRLVDGAGKTVKAVDATPETRLSALCNLGQRPDRCAEVRVGVAVGQARGRGRRTL